MTILVPFRGIIEIAGQHDAGKTLAALQTVFPYDKTVFIDDDLKGSGTVKQMMDNKIKFEKYIDLGERRAKLGNTPTSDQLLKEIVYPLIEEVTKEKHEVIIFDTWRIVYQSARDYVSRHQNEFADVVTWRGNNPIIQGLISKVARMIERKQMDLLRSSCDLLILTHHLKDKYENSVVVGEQPESSKTFDEVCNLRLWLKRNPNSKVPIVLFLKRPNLPKVENGQLKFVNIVPMKITPDKSDESIWSCIAKYEKNPIESREPKENETPTPEEFAMLSGTLTNDQKAYVLEVLKHQKEDEEEISQIVTGTVVNHEKEDAEFAGELENAFPSNSPKTAAEFLSRSMSEFGMSAEHIKEKTGIGLDKIMKASSEELSKLWEKLR